MKHRHARLLCIGCVAMTGLVSGCVQGTFGEELRGFLTATAKDTAVALGTFVVEQAVESAFGADPAS